MSYRISRIDDTGIWSQGPFDSIEKAMHECIGVIDTRGRLGECWAPAQPTRFEEKAWTNNLNHRLSIKRG